MTVETVQCPCCGGTLGVAGPGARPVCSYCGAALQSAQDGSGHVLARLSDLAIDPSVLAYDRSLIQVTTFWTRRYGIRAWE